MDFCTQLDRFDGIFHIITVTALRVGAMHY